MGKTKRKNSRVSREGDEDVEVEVEQEEQHQEDNNQPPSNSNEKSLYECREGILNQNGFINQDVV
ncbi:hypothetical protein SLEP1_g59659 [Rubroshorea leprosula]|uniref:Uncharacterized protein n=1 Tax=Rubroshorea leprosula TaxID=152421 RepID=A0AAV5MSY6_9ROSI|nr:hypothetical protein SLEP1_g59659 [Rubroshorea leprosula]